MLKQELRHHLANHFSDAELHQWYDPLSIRFNETGDRVEVSFPHVFFAQWFGATVQKKFEGLLAQFGSTGVVADYVSAQSTQPAQSLQRRTAEVRLVGVPGDGQEASGFANNGYDFDSFLVNKKNIFPLATAKDIAADTTCKYNPLIICGAHGSGKTHLLRAVAGEKASKADSDHLYVGSVDDLAALFEKHTKTDGPGLRRQLQQYSSFILDDLQDLRRHPALEDELVLLFNHFHDNGKQMVFTCADSLSSCTFMSSRLKSRLEWGLIVTLKSPDLDVRIRYVQAQCKARRIPLTREQVITLAQRFSDFRNLQGILLKIGAFRNLMGKDMAEQDFKHILDNTEGRNAPALNAQHIASVVAEHYGIPVAELVGSRRHHSVVLARQVAMFLSRKLIRMSYPALGRAFGGKDHSTVMYAIKKIEKLQRDNKDLKNEVTSLKHKCLSPDA